MKLDFSVFLSILWNVNTLVRIITITLISLAFTVGTFAESGKDIGTGKVQSGNTLNSDTLEQTKEENETEEYTETKESVSEEKKEKIKQEISSYIIDSYKAQWDKILKDIDQTLQKTAPDKGDRIEAYKKIRISLEARRNRNNTAKKVSEISRMIINEFLIHMIDSIDKKIEELKK